MQIKNVRFLMAAITTFSAYAVYVSRVNLSIAIIAMVDDGHQQQQHHHASTQAPAMVAVTEQPTQATTTTTTPQQLLINGTTGLYIALATSGSNTTMASNEQGLPSYPAPVDSLPLDTGGLALPNATQLFAEPERNGTLAEMPPLRAPAESLTLESNKQQHGETPFAGSFPASKKAILKPPLISQEKFHWDQTEQGHILGAFFYGYILFQIPGARMAESVGARWILMAATAGSAIISLVFPLSTQLNSIHLLLLLRFAMGLCQSAFFPAAYVFFCRWLPEQERSVLLPIMFIGSNMGSVSTYIMSSYLISSSFGWPSVFYVSGLICLLVTLLWFVFGSNGPHDNWLITPEEREYISKNLNNGQSPPSSSAQQLARPSATQQLALPPAIVLKCDKQQAAGAVATAISNKKKSVLNKSKSAIDLIPGQNSTTTTTGANHQQVQLSFHPEVVLLERSGRMTTATLATDANNNNNCCRQQPPTRLDDNQQVSTNDDNCAGKQLSWCKLLTSLPVWVLILSMYGNEWSQVVLTYELPTYLNTALSFPIEQNGVINSFFQLSYTVASPILSSLGAYLLDRHLLGMRKIHVRKLFQSLATFGQLACFVSVPICGANRGLIIMLMFSATLFKACCNGGDIMVPGDLSPEYAGTIFAFANSIGNTAGFVVPLLAGFIVENAYEREQWTPFWMTTATIMGCSGLIFLLLGQTNRQDFSEDEEATTGTTTTNKSDRDVESCQPTKPSLRRPLAGQVAKA